MPRFNKDDDNMELKIYLQYLIDNYKTDDLLQWIMDKNVSQLRKFVVSYKLLSHNIGKLKITDPELGYLSGRFLGNYELVENFLKKCEDKEYYRIAIEEIVRETSVGLDLLSNIYMEPGINKDTLSSRILDEENIDSILSLLEKSNLVIESKEEDKTSLNLSELTREYMRERYFPADGQEKNEDTTSNIIRSKVLYMLRNENKKEED